MDKSRIPHCVFIWRSDPGKYRSVTYRLPIEKKNPLLKTMEAGTGTKLFIM